MMVMARTPRLTTSLSLCMSLRVRYGPEIIIFGGGTTYGRLLGGAFPPLPRLATISCLCSTVAPTLPADAKSFNNDTADSKLSAVMAAEEFAVTSSMMPNTAPAASLTVRRVDRMDQKSGELVISFRSEPGFLMQRESPRRIDVAVFSWMDRSKLETVWSTTGARRSEWSCRSSSVFEQASSGGEVA